MKPRSATAKSIDSDYKFFLAHSLELGKKYPGQWVAVENGMVYHDRNFERLSRKTKEAGCVDPLFSYIPTGDLILGSAS